MMALVRANFQKLRKDLIFLLLFHVRRLVLSPFPYIYVLRDRRPSTAACPACWAMGQKFEVMYFEENKILFCSQGRTKISCIGTRSPTNQPRKDPFHLYSLSPHSPQFQQSTGAATLQSLRSSTRYPPASSENPLNFDTGR